MKSHHTTYKKRVRFQSFYEKYDSGEEDVRPPSLSLIYDSRSEDIGDRKSSGEY